MFQPTQNIDAAFRSMRLFMLLVVVGSICVSLYALYQNKLLSARVQDKVYLLSNGKAAEIFAVNRKDNLAVEAKDHVTRFHELFFSLDPDEKAIAFTIKKALYLSDASAKKKYDDLSESGYIAGIISGNVSQRIVVDSVQVNTNQEPYTFRSYATIWITRTTSQVTRNLITQGFLRNVSRTEYNPHGFLIEKWEIVDNRDIKIEER